MKTKTVHKKGHPETPCVLLSLASFSVLQLSYNSYFSSSPEAILWQS